MHRVFYKALTSPLESSQKRHFLNLREQTEVAPPLQRHGGVVAPGAQSASWHAPLPHRTSGVHTSMPGRRGGHENDRNHECRGQKVEGGRRSSRVRETSWAVWTQSARACAVHNPCVGPFAGGRGGAEDSLVIVLNCPTFPSERFRTSRKRRAQSLLLYSVLHARKCVSLTREET